jgi:hypothetical protein
MIARDEIEVATTPVEDAVRRTPVIRLEAAAVVSA